MGSRLRILHLSLDGDGVPMASIEFGPKLTLVRGPSDTGKSFVVDAIDFVLGARELKEIPESRGYSWVLLGLELPDESVVTLSRAISGGRISFFLGQHRRQPSEPPNSTMSPKHSQDSVNNISRFLLSMVNLDGNRVRKNARNVTTSLSFRDIAHLCIVDETAMQSETEPALSGSFVTQTREVAVLKLLLQDEDDSDLVEVQDKSEVSRLAGVRVDMIERIIDDLSDQLADVPGFDELRARYSDTNAAIDAQSASVETLAAERQEWLGAQSRIDSMLRDARARLRDADDLQNRLELLAQQYGSDLQRLEMIAEAGALIGFFSPGTCPYCGAPTEHQALNFECEGDQTAFGQAVLEERTKTLGLQADLEATLRDLVAEREELSDQIRVLTGRRAEAQVELTAREEALRPRRERLDSLLDERREQEKSMALFDQRHRLERFKGQVARETTADTAQAAAEIRQDVIREFSEEISAWLGAWRFPGADQVRYSRDLQDVVAGQQPRSSHGKGVRAILHAAFTVALAQYCFDRELPHPGFVVLDSPLVTYRPPDNLDLADGPPPDALPDDVPAAFYSSLNGNFAGQVIVMENTDPPDDLGPAAVDVQFTKSPDIGRYGFFPEPTEQSGPE